MKILNSSQSEMLNHGELWKEGYVKKGWAEDAE